MSRKKNALDRAAARAAEIISAHLKTLPATEAEAMRKELRALAVKSSRSARRGKASRSRKSGGPRPLSRIYAKSA